jgi:hypothetical protein
MLEAKGGGDGSRRYKKVKSYYDTAVKYNLRRKGTTLAASPKLPKWKNYKKQHSAKNR